MAENSNSVPDALQALVRAQLLDVNTSIPGVVVSYSNGRASVRPSGKKRFADGDALDFPEIPNVRVCWPSFSGGNAGVKGPIKPGDRCLIVFSQQAIDGTDDRRAFDLQDAYAVMVDPGNSASANGGNNADLVLFFGSAFIKLTPSGALEINAPGGTTITTTTATIDAATTTTTGAATVQGLLTYQNGLSGAAGSGASTISGAINHSGGSITSNGIVLHTHRHSGVQAGASNTGTPV